MSPKNSENLKLPKAFSFVRKFQGISEYLLDNGLKVLLFPDQSLANITVNITYLVGSRHEGRGEAGMAHLLEHMLFRGTETMKNVKGALQDKGAKFNATTWYDRTNYYETLTPTLENLEFALKLEADRMINSLILPEDLASEMTVVRNEFEMGENNPVHVLHDQMMSAAYRWHNYGKTTIGNRSDIERVPASSLRKFYEAYYQPDNAVLVVAGQFNNQDAIDLIDKTFAPIPRPSRVIEETYTEEPAQDGPRQVVLERVGDMASVAAAYHIPASTHKDHAAVRIFMDAITDEPTGLIYKKLVDSSKASELFAMVYALYEPGMALCFTRPTNDKDAFSIKDELNNLIEVEAVSSLDIEQVERAKVSYLRRFKQAMTNSKEIALKLSESIACGDWRLWFWYKEQVAKLGLDEVKLAAKKYFIKSNRTSGIFLPQKSAERVQIECHQDFRQALDALVEDPSLCEGEAFVATAENIEAKTQRKAINGEQQVAILAKKTRGQAVKANCVIRYSNEDALKKYHEELVLMPSLLLRGTSKYSHQKLKDKIESLMSSIDLNGQAGALSASLKSDRQNFSELLPVFAHILKSPKFLEEEFRVVKQREIDDQEESKNDPQRVAFHQLDKLKYPWPKDNFFYVPSIEERIEEIKALKLDKIKEAYESIFSTSRMHMALVGDVDEDQLENLMPDFAQSEKTPYQRLKRQFIANVHVDEIIDTKDKEMALIAYAYNFPMRDDHEDFAALRMASYLFGENMNSRLMSRIREKEGISYGAGSWLEASRHDEIASINLYAMAAPASVSRGKVAIVEEWNRFIEQGPQVEELKSAQESIWLSFINNLANDAFLAHTLASDLEIGRDFYWRQKLFEKIKALSPNDISQAMQKWWAKPKFSVVVAADKAKLA